MMGPFTGTVNYSAVLTTPPSSGTIYLNFPNPTKVLNGSPDSLLLNIITTIDVHSGHYTGQCYRVLKLAGPRTHTRSFSLVVTSVQECQQQPNYPNLIHIVSELSESI